MPLTTKVLNGLQLLVFAIPATIFGISLILFYNQPALNFIYAGYGIVLIGFVGKFSFIATKIIGNSLKQIPSSLDEAAQIEGISSFSRLKNILLPLLLPGIFITFIISFIFCFGEIGISIMVYPPGTELMPIKVFTIMANAPQALISAMTLIVFSITLLLISIFYLIFKSQFNSNET
jgi:iron(III) transport system permease protein